MLQNALTQQAESK